MARELSEEERIAKAVDDEEAIAAQLAAEEGPPDPNAPEEGNVEYVPDVGPKETANNRFVDMIPLGNLVTNSAAAGLLRLRQWVPGLRDEGERARLTPQARAELEAMNEPLPADSADKGLLDTYRDVRDTRRERTAAGVEQNPNASKLGVAAGLAASTFAPLPRVVPKNLQGLSRLGAAGARIKAAAQTGAAYGAAQGATDGEADLTGGDVVGTLKDTAKGLLTGGIGGALLGTAVEAAAPAAGRLRSWAIAQGRRAIGGKSDIAAGTRKPLDEDSIVESLERRLIRPFASTPGNYQRIDAAAEEQGTVLGKILSELEAAGVRGPRVKPLVDRLMARYHQEMMSAPADTSAEDVFRNEAQAIQARKPEGERTLGLTQAEGMKRKLQSQARLDKINTTGKDENRAEVASAVRQAVEEAVDLAAAQPNATPAVRAGAERFVPQKRVVGNLIGARDVAEKGASKALQAQGTSLGDMALGSVGATNPVQAYLQAMLVGGVRNRLPSTQAAYGYRLAQELAQGGASSRLARGAEWAANQGQESAQDWADEQDPEEQQGWVRAALVQLLRRKKSQEAGR